MIKALLTVLLVAAPGLALAQSGGQTATGSVTQPMPNQANPQAQANRQRQPANAHAVTSGPGLGQAATIPTPTLHDTSTPVR